MILKFITTFILLCILSLRGVTQYAIPHDSQRHGVQIDFPDSIFCPTLSQYMQIEEWFQRFNDQNIAEMLQIEASIINFKRQASYINDTLHGNVQYFINDTILVLSGNYCSGHPCGIFDQFNISISNDIIFIDHKFSVNYSSKTGLKDGPSITYISWANWFQNDYNKHNKESVSPKTISSISHYQNGIEYGPELLYNKSGSLESYLLFNNGHIKDGKYLSRMGVTKYRNGKVQKAWLYSSDDGRLIRNSNTPTSFSWRFLNFNRLIFPISRIVKGMLPYEEYVNRKLR